MNIVVLAKWVPEPQGTPSMGPDHLLVRDGVDGALDPGDEIGLEAALQLVERDGGEVTVISVGPEVATAAVQRALAMGAHRGVLVTDDALRGADALMTARVLAAVVRRAEDTDLVIAGVESTDGYTGTLPATVAEILELPSVTFARSLDVADGAIRAERQTATGYDVVTCPLPAVVTLTAGATEPRYPSLKGVMAAKQKPFDRLTVGDLGLDVAGLAPSQRVVAVEAAPTKAAGEVIDAGDDAVTRIADLLAEAKVI
jgi:electron transfer flavoprotein beta subunit